MNNKFLTALSVALTTFFSLSANVYTVTNTTGNGACPGTAGSFTKAVCDAATNPGRDTVVFDIAGGSSVTYWGEIAVTASDLLIIGYSINATNTGVPVVLAASVSATGNNVEFRGIDFKTANHSLTIKGNNNIVRNCSFETTGWGQNNLWINGGNNSSVISCNFSACKLHAISIENTGGHTIDSCTTNGIEDIGIMIRGSGSNIVKNTTVENGKKNGIGIEFSNSNTIENCTSKNNTWAGIVVVPTNNTTNYPNDNTITNCRVFGNGQNGIELKGNNNTVEKTHIYDNCTATVVTSNQNDYHYAGINVGAGTNTIDSCYVYNNGANGILFNLANTSNSVVKRNLIGRSANGTEAGNAWNGVWVRYGADVTIEDNVIVNNGKSGNSPAKISGIRIQEALRATIRNNYIGTDAAKTNAGNDFDGITLHTNVSNVTITGNTIAYNGFNSTHGNGGGIALRDNSDNNTIQSNYIGMHSDLSDAGNYDYGISIEENCSGNLIGGDLPAQGNNIGYSKNSSSGAGDHGVGIWISENGATSNEVFSNSITFNTNEGVLIENGASTNTIGKIGAGNTINNNTNGILVQDNGAAANRNSLRGNSFSCNSAQGITLLDNGNNLYGGIGNSKTVTTSSSEARPTFVSGTAPANAAVDIYTRDAACAVLCDNSTAQGATYVTTVSAQANGTWEFDFSGTAVTKANVIVMATDTSAGAVPQNSSEFSVCSISCTAPQNVVINGNDSICAGGSSTIVANSTGKKSSNDYRYTWYAGSVAPANVITPLSALNDSNLTISTAGTYFVIITDTIDSSTCSTTSGPFALTVSPNPTQAINAAVNTFCSGDSVQITSGNSSANLSYAWTPSGETTENIFAKVGGTHEVTITDNTTKCFVTASVSLTMNPSPTITVDPDQSYCAGADITLDAQPNVGAVVSWTGDTTASAAQITVRKGTYNLSITENGCTSNRTITVTENPLPIPNATATTYCRGDSSVIDAGIGDMAAYNWVPNKGTTQMIRGTQGTYTVTVTDTNGCVGQSSAYADVNPDENPTVQIGNDTTLCIFKNEEVELTVNYTGGLGGSIEWSNGTIVDTKNDNDPVRTAFYNDTVMVWVMYTDTFSCKASDTLLITNYCEPPEITVPNVFIPGGNPDDPTSNPVFTPFGDLAPDDILQGHMEVYNRWGRLMFVSDERIPKWDGTFSGAPASTGVYFWIWNYEDVTQTQHRTNGFVQLLQKK